MSKREKNGTMSNLELAKVMRMGNYPNNNWERNQKG
jgi:hypothetical protein